MRMAALLLALAALTPCAGPVTGTMHRALTEPGSSNPHGRAGQCLSCHAEGAAPAAATFQPTACAACHDPAVHDRLIHATGLAPEQVAVPEGNPLAEGRLDCRTCHLFACQPEGRGVPVSLRGSPFARPGDFCFRCHERGEYQGLYPHGPRRPLPARLLRQHRELADTLEATLLRCGACHGGVRSSFGALDPKVGRPRVAGTELCRTCHFDRSHQYRHLGVSLWQNSRRPEAMGRLAAFQKSWKVRLPLQEGQQIACTTCHLPSASCGTTRAEGDSLATRLLLRVPRKVICKVCHDEI